MNDRLLPERSPADQANADRHMDAHDRAFASHYVTLPNGNKVSKHLLKQLGYDVDRDGGRNVA